MFKLVFPRHIRIYKKVIALSLAVIHLYVSTAGGVDWGNIIQKDKRDRDRESSGYFNLKNLDKKRKLKESLIKKKNIQEEDKKKSLQKAKKPQDKPITDKELKKQIALNQQELEKTAQAIRDDIERIRKKRYDAFETRAEFKHVTYDDGKIVYMKDGLAMHIKNELVRDDRGVLVRKDTDAITYDDKRLMTSYHAEETDNNGNVSTTDWAGNYTQDSVFYADNNTNAGKKLTDSKEITVDYLGHTKIIEMTDARYDRNNRLIKNKQKITDKFGNITRTDYTAISFDDKNNVTASHEEITNPLGITSIKDRSGMVYEKNSNYRGDGDSLNSEYILKRYTETVTDGQGAVTVSQQKDITYNENGQITSFAEEFTDKFGNVEKKIWKDGVYNEHGDLLSYHQETTDESGYMAVTDWHEAEYKNHLLVGYTKDEVDERGTSTREYWVGAEYDTYERLVSYRQKNIDGRGNTTWQERKDMEYDRYQRVLAYHDVNTDNLGNASDIIMSDIIYDQYSQILRYAKSGIDIFGNAYKEVMENARYNYLGLILTYDKEFTDALGVVTTQAFRDAAYNSDGQLENYYEVKTDGLGAETASVWSGMEYNQFGDLVTYNKDVAPETGDSYSVVWSGAAYNEYAELVSYNQSKKDVFGDITDTEWRNGTYDQYGHLQSFLEKTIDPFGLLSTKNWSGAEYNRYHQLKSYNETLAEVGDAIVTRYVLPDEEIWNTYSLEDQEALINGERVVIGGEEISLGTEEVLEYQDDITVSHRSDIVYDRYNRMVSYIHENEITKNGIPGAPVVHRSVLNFVRELDVYGRTTLYTREERKTNDNGLDLVTVTDWQGTYNYLSQVVYFMQQVHSEGQGYQDVLVLPEDSEDAAEDAEDGEVTYETERQLVSLDLTNYTERHGITYDPANGQVSGYVEITNSSSAPDLTRTKTVSDLTYAHMNKPETFTHVLHEFGIDNEGNEMNTTVTTHRLFTEYDDLGNVTMSVDRNNTDGNESEELVIKTGQVYENGMLVSGDTITVNSGVDSEGNIINTSSLVHTSGTRYNDFNQAVYWDQISTSNSAPSRVIVENIYVSYNAQGQRDSFVSYNDETGAFSDLIQILEDQYEVLNDPESSDDEIQAANELIVWVLHVVCTSIISDESSTSEEQVAAQALLDWLEIPREGEE
ncbi:MAG: hypothetical protein ABII23_09480, partial [bacterium]